MTIGSSLAVAFSRLIAVGLLVGGPSLRGSLRIGFFLMGLGAVCGETSALFPAQTPLPVAPPEDAVVLFDGGTTNRFRGKDGGPPRWPVVDGALVSSPLDTRSNHLVSAYHFRDAEIHVEFLLPQRESGNSGIYIHGHYELQIIDSHHKESLSQHDMGAVYGFAPPLAQAQY